jgi:hypothetical protein
MVMCSPDIAIRCVVPVAAKTRALRNADRETHEDGRRRRLAEYIAHASRNGGA